MRSLEAAVLNQLNSAARAQSSRSIALEVSDYSHGIASSSLTATSVVLLGVQALCILLVVYNNDWTFIRDDGKDATASGGRGAVAAKHGDSSSVARTVESSRVVTEGNLSDNNNAAAVEPSATKAARLGAHSVTCERLPPVPAAPRYVRLHGYPVPLHAVISQHAVGITQSRRVHC
jgi:hypothetical protein